MTEDKVQELRRWVARLSAGGPAGATEIEPEDLKGLLSRLLPCLSSDAAPEIMEALYSLSTLSQQYPALSSNGELIGTLVERIPTLLQHHFKPVRYQAIDFYVWVREYFPDFRERMLGYLTSEDHGLRASALFHYESYCQPVEIEPLLIFEHDDFTRDVRMAGPYVYDLRNKALLEIEKQLNRRFPGQLRREPYLGVYVEWRDWGPFLTWYKDHRA